MPPSPLTYACGSRPALASPLTLTALVSRSGLADTSIMQGIGEMTAYLPVPGGHLTYAGRFVDPALAFAVNWSYAIQWMLVCPAE